MTPERPRHPDALEVVIVAYGAPTLLEACLGALGDRYPVIVVDNSSDPAVEAVAGRHRAAYVDPGANGGFAAGVNRGIAERAHPTADVLLLNPDAQITPESVAQLHHCLHATPGLACVAPSQIDPTTGEAARVTWPFPSPLRAWAEALGLGRWARRQDFVIGSVVAVRSEALADVGPFDEQFFLYAEETDWQRRAHDRGWRAKLCPEVTAFHVGGGTDGEATAREIHFHASHQRYITKHFGRGGWRIYRSGVMCGSLVRALVWSGQRGRTAADRFHLYRRDPVRIESGL